MKKNKTKQILAILGIIGILILFCLPMIFAFQTDEDHKSLFLASLGAVFLLPILLYAILMMRRVLGGNRKNTGAQIDYVIFDVGKVLVSFDFQKYLKELGFSRGVRDAVMQATVQTDIWVERDRGLKTEAEYVEEMVKRAPAYEKQIRLAMEQSQNSVEVFPYTEAWLQYLQGHGLGLYVLSNYPKHMLEHEDARNQKLSFLSYMNGVVFSSEVGLLKPEKEIYRHLLKTYGLNPARGVMIDDCRENVEAAKAAGLKGICFENFDQAAKELDALLR